MTGKEELSDDEFGWGQTESKLSLPGNRKSGQFKNGRAPGSTGFPVKKNSTGFSVKKRLTGSLSSSDDDDDDDDVDDRDTLNGIDEMTQERKEDTENEQV